MPAIPLAQALDFAMQAHRGGRLAEAEGIYRQILTVAPNHADALHLLGVIASQTGSPAIAVDLIQQAIAQNPSAAEFRINLGDALQTLRRFDEAVTAYQQALELRPALTIAHNNLGNALKHQGRIEEAIAAYRRALQLQPELAEAHNNLAHALQIQGRIEDAIASFRHAIVLNPNDAMTHNNLGNALLGRGQTDDAIDAFRRALELVPDFALAHNNFGNALKMQGRSDEAIDAYRRAVNLQPSLAMAHNNLGNALKEQGAFADAITCFRRALDAQPDAANIHSNFLAALHDDPGTTLADLFAAHREYDRRHAAPLAATWHPHENSCEPERPLRLGFVSAHFANHPVGRFLVRPLEAIDRNQFQLIFYSETSSDDETTRRLKATATTWRAVTALNDEDLSRQIREDRVDVLFDLAGHTVGNRLLVFARKPAPVQITWLDYVGTTGLTAIDYILADGRQIPPAAEAFYSERVLRMPDDYICYDPPIAAPPTGDLPALENGGVTFGSFNTLAKTTPQMIAVWVQILKRVPQSRLILKNRGLEEPSTVSRLHNLFAAHGIAADRVEMLGRSAPSEVLACYQHIDIGLDTFPYNGGLTTCEALWMGVPVITCVGETFASRHGLAHLSAVGLIECVTENLASYADTTVALAEDLPRLAALRASLRERVATSALCDGKKFAENLAALLREAWRRWCASDPA